MNSKPYIGTSELYRDIQMMSETGWVTCKVHRANGDWRGQGREDGLWTPKN